MSIGSLATAKSYLCASDDGFWKWSENGEAVEIDDGATIAFRSQLSHLVAAFEPAGLPPFELIIVTVAACRSPLTGWPQAFLRELSQLGTLRRSTGHWADFIDELTRLPTLPTSIRSTMPGLQAIVKLAVEGVRRTPENTSESVKQVLSSQEMVAEHIAGLTISRSLSDRARDLVQLGRNLRHVTEDNVRRLMTTGHVDLPRPIEPEEIVLPDPEPVVEPPTAAALTPVELLKELQRHEQHATTVRLVKEIRAAIAIPRRIVPGDDLGLGGVSDLINRGELDRLLLSELAQDDDVLMIRVALREALFLRREAPPSPPADARALLVDQGLRLWGQPRFLAAAVMLAFMVEHESLGGLNLFRSVRHELQSFTAQSTAEYEEQIAALDPALHCGAAIPDFAEACRENRWEPIIITSDDAYADETFRRPLREAGFSTCYVAVVERSGRLRLISRSERGEKVLRTAVFDLERRAENTVLPALRREAADPNRPAILKRNPFPLHLSCDQPSAQKLLPLSEFHRAGVVGLTGDRRLVFWEDLSSGGPRQIFDRLPGGALHWWGFGQADRDELLLVMGEPSHGSVHLVRASLVPGGDCDVAELGPAEGLKGVTCFQDRFYLIRQSDIEVFEVADGRWLNSTAIPPEIYHSQARFFRSRQFIWLAMSVDGNVVRFDELGFPSTSQRIFDCEPLGLPVAIDFYGRAFLSGSQEPRQAIRKSAGYLLVKSVT
ncbi:MAG TPA: hypothetical protein VM510_04700, partial [Caulifigura sp.]|nr:hypothetical protein [Caulifigura sp.]